MAVPAGVGPVLTTVSLVGSGGRPATGGATVRTVCLGVARRYRAPCGERSAHPDLARHGNCWGIRAGDARHRRSHRATTRGGGLHRGRGRNTAVAQSDSSGSLPSCGTGDRCGNRGVCHHRVGGSPRAVGQHMAVRAADRRRGDRDSARYGRSEPFPRRGPGDVGGRVRRRCGSHTAGVRDGRVLHRDSEPGVSARAGRALAVAAAVVLAAQQCAPPAFAVAPPPIDNSLLPSPAAPAPPEPTEQRGACAVPLRVERASSARGTTGWC